MIRWIQMWLQRRLDNTYWLEARIQHVRWVMAGRPKRRGITVQEACDALKPAIEGVREQWDAPSPFWDHVRREGVKRGSDK